jgi:anti-sigma factor RsiW
MHPPIENELERHLEGRPTSSAFAAHLEACAECREELSIYSEHSELFRTLRVEESVQPAPGFYARVMNQIESQIKPSVWDLFVQPFGRKFAYASLALLAVLAAVLFTAEAPQPQVVAKAPETILATEPVEKNAAPATQVDHRIGAPDNRGATLVNLTAMDQ